MNSGPVPSPRAAEGEQLFATTNWTTVEQAKDGDTRALETLLNKYYLPLFKWVLRKHVKREDAEDLVQEFFAHLLTHDWPGRVDRKKGRLRRFLLTALKHYLGDHWDKVNAQKRGGGRQPDSLDETDDHGHPILEPKSPLPSPDEEYQINWAKGLLDASLKRLRRECADKGHADLYDALEPALYRDTNAPSHLEVGQKLGKSEAAVKMAFSRIRSSFALIFRDEVLQTLADPADLEEELKELRICLQKAGGGA
jgi:RNA polymerase sigma-70 factor (ECF subfamily)